MKPAWGHLEEEWRKTKGGGEEGGGVGEKDQAQQVVSERLGVSKDNTCGTINRSTGP